MTIAIPATLAAILIIGGATLLAYIVGAWVTMMLAWLIWPDIEIGALAIGFWGGIISGAVAFYFALDYVLGAVQ